MSADLGAAAPIGGERGPVDSAASVTAAAAAYVRGILDLAAAEARLAAVSGASMLLLVIVAAAFVILAWVLLAGVAAYVLVAMGLSWPAAGLSLAAAHAFVAYVLWRWVMRLSRALTLPALRRAVLSADE